MDKQSPTQSYTVQVKYYLDSKTLHRLMDKYKTRVTILLFLPFPKDRVSVPSLLAVHATDQQNSPKTPQYRGYADNAGSV